MSLQTIKEDLLYRLLPEGVLSLDQRGLMRALIGGYQERVSDLRSYVSKFELLYDPSAEFPETGNANVLEVVYTTEDGVQATRTLPVVYETPLPTNYADVGDGTYTNTGTWSDAAIEWAANQLGIPLNWTETGNVTTVRSVRTFQSAGTAPVGPVENVYSVVKVTLKNDPLKSVDINTLYYLAATVGAVLYKTPTEDPTVSVAEQRRVLYGYFPRLKI